MALDAAQTLKTIRRDLGLSQAAFAKRLGVTLRAVQYWEAGERPVKETVLRLAQTLDFEPSPGRTPGQTPARGAKAGRTAK